MLVVIVLTTTAGYSFWYLHRPLPEAITTQSLFEGIVYTREIRQEPRPVIIHVVEIDLDAPGLEFIVTPTDLTSGDGAAYPSRTTSEFLGTYDVQLAINGDFFEPWHDNGPFDYYPHVDDPVRARGFTASQGQFITEGYVSSYAYNTLYISADNQLSFDESSDTLYNAISGYRMILREGEPGAWRADAYLNAPHPRTAVALSQDERTMFLVVVDGRQPNYSEGVTLDELADIISEFGGYTALNFDGGGSSTLVIQGADGKAIQLNSPIHSRIPGNERPIANHLGIFALPLN